jgi:two-component system LytT family response regulator
MAKIRALLVDDEPIARLGIRQQLESEDDVEIIGECSNGAEAVATINAKQPDLVFLDVQMPLLNGLGVVEAIRVEHLPAVVFVTAYDEHAIRAFEVNAVDYLLKPIDHQRFKSTLQRVRTQLNAARQGDLQEKIATLTRLLGEYRASPQQTTAYQSRIVIKEPERVSFLEVAEVDWIGAHGNYVQVHSRGKLHLVRDTLDGMEQKLDPAKFIRLRRSAIVNVDQIKELHPLFNGEYTIVLKDGYELTSSRRYRRNLDALLKN